MMRNDNRFKELIKQSIEDEMARIPENVMDEDLAKLGIEPPPADMLDRIKKACAEAEAAETKKKRRIKWRVIIPLVAAFVAIAGTFAAYGVNVYEPKTKNTVTNNAIRFIATNESAYEYEPEELKAYENAEKDLGVSILKPTYLPEGFKFDKVRIYPNQHVILMYKNEEKTIKFTQTLSNEQASSAKTVDANDQIAYTFIARGRDMEVSEYEQANSRIVWLNSVWKDENLIYEVEANCSKEEFEKFIVNLE